MGFKEVHGSGQNPSEVRAFVLRKKDPISGIVRTIGAFLVNIQQIEFI